MIPVRRKSGIEKFEKCLIAGIIGDFSQRQQRTVALSIKMAELDFMREHTGNRPILLLDDVFGELDAARRQQLLTAVGDCQTILTCTNVEALPLDRSRIDALYKVDQANVTLWE